MAARDAAKVQEAIESDSFLALPGSFDIHEWSIMERFAHDQAVGPHRDELVDALHGRGAFRMFLSAVRRLGLKDEWYRFRDSAFEEIAKEWLEVKSIEYE